MTQEVVSIAPEQVPPRARGALRLSVKPGPPGRELGALDGLRMSGSLKLVFPRPAAQALEAVIVNTAGGVTGGDRFTTEAEAAANTRLTLTTQAAERAYRATGADPGRVSTRLALDAGARLAWLPQETILFEGANLRRRLRVDIAGDARFLMVEPVVFGRAAMGEELRAARFDDRVEIRRDGALLWLDAVRLAGDLAAQLDRPAIGAGARAMAGLAYAGPDATAMRDRLRAILPQTAGVSCPAEGLLAARVLARDGFELRAAILPALRLLHSDDLPRPWML